MGKLGDKSAIEVHNEKTASGAKGICFFLNAIQSNTTLLTVEIWLFLWIFCSCWGLLHLFGIPCQPFLTLHILPCGEMPFFVLELLPRPLCFHSLFYFLVTALTLDLTACLLMPCTNMLTLWSHGARQNYLLLQSWLPVVLASCLFRRTPGTGLILIQTCWVSDKMDTSEISNGVKFICQACIFYWLSIKYDNKTHTEIHKIW